MSKMQSIIMSNPKLTNWFMSTMPASFWERISKKTAIKIFYTAARRVPAYKDFLKKQKIDPNKVKTIRDLAQVPIIDKKNYIHHYKLADLALDGKLSDKYTIERSSGHSGNPFFWPRLPEEDRIFPKYIEYAFLQFYRIDQKSTLVIVTLALGTWTSGEKMAQALRQIAMTGNYPLSVISPGTNIDEVIEIVRCLSEEYEQTVIVGYPPFLKTVIDRGEEQGIDWKALNIKLGLGGEGYSEAWREYVARKLGIPVDNYLAISGGYGAADLGMSIGREYPMTVLVRKLCEVNKNLAMELFRDTTIPSVVQYNPGTCYVESSEGELLFTIMSGIPLVRYNIHDRGGVISFRDVIEIFKSHGTQIEKLLCEKGYTKEDIWQLPFFYVFGRSDGAISIGGPNIYPENIDAALYGPETHEIHSFMLSRDFDPDHNVRFHILVELKKEFSFLSESRITRLEVKYHDVFLKKLLEVNSEFRNAYSADPSLDPIIRIYPYGKGPFSTDKGKIKRRYIHLNRQ